MATDTEPEVVTVDGEEFYQWKVALRVPKNWTPESGVIIAVAPPGGIANFPAAIQGKAGLPPTFRNTTMVELAYEDPTPASVAYTLITPGTSTTGPVYDVEFTLHKGAPGTTPAVNLLTAGDLDDGGDPTPKYIFQVNAAGDGVELVAQKVGNLYWPTSVTALSNASGNTGNGLAQITIPTQPWPYRLCAEGQQTISLDGTNVKVDIVARLGGTGTGTGADDGNVIARGQGLPGSAALMQNLVLSPVPPVNAAAGFGEVSDGASRVVYFRAEQVGSGTDTFDTDAARGFYGVRVEALR